MEAHPEPIIKWYRDDVVVRSSPDYEITYENGVCRLSIAETFPEDSGVFKVIATNADGSDTTQAKLQVQSKSSGSSYEPNSYFASTLYIKKSTKHKNMQSLCRAV